jgi:large subunit ribosomal protein L13
MKTYLQTVEEGRDASKWLIVDATNVPVGRLASRVANLIRGKHRPQFTPSVDGGDFVVVINAGKVGLTGNKATDKMHFRHTGFAGGIKAVSAGDMRKDNPERLVESAVVGMLPAGVLGHRMAKKLKVYAGSEHPHAAQNPEVIKF